MLDPTAKTEGRWQPPARLPDAVRDFGKYPDTSQWQPGDVLLFSHTNPVWISRLIIRSQRRLGFGSEHSKWHHAAVYIGDGYIVEATARGVRHNDLYPYLGSHFIRIRRDPEVTINEGYRIAVAALRRHGYSYGFWSVLLLGWQAFTLPSASAGKPPSLSQRTRICSQLYFAAHDQITARTLGREDPDLTPAAISASNALVDVPSKWLAF